ncbi:hypothetical protein [Egbenema bharatensis]
MCLPSCGVGIWSAQLSQFFHPAGHISGFLNLRSTSALMVGGDGAIA